MLGKQCVAILVVGTVGMQQEQQQLFSTGYDVNGFLSETFFALVLARSFLTLV
jgi:hypothetical protein